MGNCYNLQTEIMKSEFERLQARLPMDMLSMKRYELPQPPAGKMTDVSAWNECVENSQAQLEHQALRYTAKHMTVLKNVFTLERFFFNELTLLSIEWNSIRLGGPAHEIATTSCTQKMGELMINVV